MGKYSPDFLSKNSPGFLEEREKEPLRSFYRKKVIELSPLAKRKKQESAAGLLAQLPFWEEARFIAGYQALKDEPCLSSFYKLWEDKLCFPIVSHSVLKFYKASGKRRKNSLSVLEPLALPQNQIPLSQISVFLIPGRVFDRWGGRLGRGQGYYDRALAPLAHKRGSVFKNRRIKKALFAGIAFAEQIHNDRLSLLPHDILMDFVATDRFVLMPLREGESLSKGRARRKARAKAPAGKAV